MSAIAAYRTAILDLLDDPLLARFTNNQIDRALRWALEEYSKARPLVSTYLLDTDGTCRLAMPDGLNIQGITRVDLWNADPSLMLSVTFYAYQADETWIVETMYSKFAAGNFLQVTYGTLHTIDGLDSAAGTTIPEADEAILQVGAAGQAAQMRTASRAEAINLNNDAVKLLQGLATQYLALFRARLAPSSTAPAFAELEQPTGSY
jgi:hypothetical protein